MRCFHCHEAIPAGFSLTVAVDGQQQPVCCQGCANAMQWIRDSGLSGFYQLREAPANRPQGDSDWSAYDGDALSDTLTTSVADGRHEALLVVGGIRCAACTWLIESALLALDGVVEVSINAATARARVLFNRQQVRLSEILETLQRLGYQPQPLSRDRRRQQALAERRSALRRLAVAGLGMMQVMTYSVALYAGLFQGMAEETRDFFRWLALLVATPVVLYSGWPFLQRAWQGLRQGRAVMDQPVALAILVAWLASAWITFRGGEEVYFDSAVMFVFFLSLARYLEMRLRHRAESLGSDVGAGLPATALRLAHGNWQPTATSELQPGDEIRIPPGTTVPVDGQLLDAHVRVDESLLSGETAALEKIAGDTLVAGSVLLEGPIRLSVTSVGDGTVYAAIQRLLMRAQAQRPGQLAMADRIAGWVVAGVLLLSLATLAGWWAVSPQKAFAAALSVLVITCPCALSLATPSVLAAAMAGLVRRGILLVRPGALETLTRADWLVSDKTGTLTDPGPDIERVERLGPLPEDTCLQLAAALEQGIRHPLAAAFRRDAGPLPEVTGQVLHAGLGVSGSIEGVNYRLGQAGFAAADDDGVDSSKQALVLSREGQALCRFHLRETLRPQASASLEVIGLPVMLLSGDAPDAVERVARQLRIEKHAARQSPEDKLQRVAALQQQGAVVAMLGDGSNDAPVLARADVSIAMDSGSALASQAADAIVLNGRLASLADLWLSAWRVRRLIRQNLSWALAYNLLAVPLAVAGLVPPWLAALGMSASSLVVVLNATRARQAPRAAAMRTRSHIAWQERTT